MNKTSVQAISHLTFLLLLCAAGTLAFANSFYGTYVFDDLPNIVENERLRSFREAWDAHRAEIPIGLRRRDVGRWSFVLNYAISGLDTWSYHATNLAIHLGSGLLLFGIVRRTVVVYSNDEQMQQDANWLACGIAAIWVVHPIQTESVTYIVQRLESLCGLFYLACIYCTLRGSQSKRSWPWYIGTLVACLAGMATKEVMVTAPLVLLTFDRTFLVNSWRQLLRQRWWMYAGTALLMGSLIYSASGSIFRKRVPPTPVANQNPSVDVIEKKDLVQGDIPPRKEYLQTQPSVVLHYIRLAFWPSGQCLDHRWPVSNTFAEIVPPLIAIGAMIAIGIVAMWKYPPVGFLILSFFVILSPTSTIIPLRVMFEHRMYLPLACLITLVTFGLYRLPRLRSKLPAILVVVTIVLAVTTHQRNKVYYSQIAMFADNVEKAPHNPRAHLNLSDALLEEGLFTEARAAAGVAVELHPKDPTAWACLGSVLVAGEAYREAIGYFVHAIELDPNNTMAHHRLAESLDQIGRWEEAEQHFLRAIELGREDSQIHSDYGAALAAQGQLEKAEIALRTALRLDSSSFEAHNNLGIVIMMGRQDVDQAIEHFRTALQLDPTSRDARLNLERAMAQSTQ